VIPNLKPFIEPLTTRFPAAWAKAKAPHDDGEFNARVCAVLHYEEGMVAVGRNGKRGDPSNLSRDVINWRGEGPNPDPVNGGFGTIIDFIGGHESPSAGIIQITPDPNGPGAWVQPLTLAQIDAGTGPPPQPDPVQPYPDEPSWWEGVFDAEVAKRYASKGQAFPNPRSARWSNRTAYDIRGGMTKEASMEKHLKELDAELGL
jgi:hypothetical protein